MKNISILIALAAAKEIKTDVEKIKAVCGNSEIDVPIKIMSDDINIIRTELHYEIDKLLDSYEDIVKSKENETKVHIWRPKGV